MLVVCLVLSRSAWGQLGKAALTGTVSDATGAPIPGVAVTIVNQDTGATRRGETKSIGLYHFDFLDIGVYTVRFEIPQFQTSEFRNVILTVGETVTVDTTLALAGITSKAVIVESLSPQRVQLADSQVSGLVDRSAIQALPLEIRDPVALVNLMPGAIPSAIGTVDFNGSTRGSAVNGTRGGMGNFLIDGFDNNDQGQGGRGHNSVGSIPGGITGVSPDAVQEFRVITSNFSAQYGRQGGFVADTVLKSGTNEVHGSLFEYNRNQSLVAQEFFSNASGTQDSLVRNQFGGSLGGPLRQDKTFFFGAVEFQRLRQEAPNLVSTVTPEFINFVENGGFAAFHESGVGGLCMQALGAPCVGALTNSRTLGPIAQNLVERFPFPSPTGNFTTESSGILTSVLGLQFLYPVPLFGDADVRNRTVFNENRFTLKVDHNLGTRDHLSARMIFDDFDSVDSSLGTDAAGSPHFPSTALARSQNWGLEHVHIFTPEILNEFRVSFLRFSLNAPRNTAPDVPSLSTAVDSLTVGLGLSTGLPLFFVDNQIQLQDHLALVRGRHSLKLGGEYRRIRNGSAFEVGRDGFFLPYDTENLLTDGFFGDEVDQLLFGGPSLGGFLLAGASIDPQTSRRPDYYRGFRANEVGLYFQDDWKVSDRLTLNFGVRWDYFGPPHNFRPGLDSNFFFGDGSVPLNSTSSNPFFPSNSAFFARVSRGDFEQRDRGLWKKDGNNFAPRFGFAWNVFGSGKTIVRGGGGIFYDRIWNNLFENIRFNPPSFSFATVGAFLNGVPVGPLATPGLFSIPIDTQRFSDPAFQPLPSATHVDEKIVTPYVEHVSFGLQQSMSPDLMLGVNYVGTFGHKLTGIVDANTFAGRTSGAGGFERPNPGITKDALRSNFYNSNYHAMQVRVEKRSSEGLQFQSNYTWSKALDFVSDAFFNRAAGGSDGILPGDISRRDLEYGPADFDVRHRFITSLIYRLPLARRNRWMGGWTIGSILTLQTGLPFTLHSTGFDANQDGHFNDRINFVVPGPLRDIIDHSQSPADGYFKTDDLVLSTPAPAENLGLWTLGKLGRNVLTGPGYAAVDISLAKQFQLTEDARFQLQLNFFNLLNRSNFALDRGVAGNFASSQFGRATATYGPRVVQIAARIDF